MSEQPEPPVVSTNDGLTADPIADPVAEPHPLRRAFRLIATAIFIYVMLVEIVLSIGFVFLLFGIEPSSWFVDVVYRTVDRTMQPFRGLFTAIEFGTDSPAEVQPAVESSIVFAMIVYGIIALAAHDMAEWLGRPRRH